MGAEKGAHDFERLKTLQFTKGDEDFAFAGPVEAVAGFGFERGGPVPGELRQMRKSAGVERSGRGGAKFADAIDDAAAGAGDLFVGGAGDALLVFCGARAGVNEVGVRIDEAGKDDAAMKVELAGATRFRQSFDAAARADGSDAAFANEERAVVKDAGSGERAAPARRGSPKGENFRAIGDEPSVRLARIRHFGFGCSR